MLGRTIKKTPSVTKYGLTMGAAMLGTLGHGQATHGGTLRTWAGDTSDTWTLSTNWSDGDVPNTADEDALIDGDSGQNTVVTFNAGAGTTIGTLTIDAGDTVQFAQPGSNANSLTLQALSNAGTLLVRQPGHTATQFFAIQDSGTIFNTATGVITVSSSGSGGNANRNAELRLAADHTNLGTINVNNTDASTNSTNGNLAAIVLSGGGIFTNNGTINLNHTGTTGATHSYAEIRVAVADVDPVSVTLGGNGTLTMGDAIRNRIVRTGAGAGAATLINGADHTIVGAGRIGHAVSSSDPSTGIEFVINHGLINATGTNNPLSINPGRTSTSNVGTITNSATGRMVAAGQGGLTLGASGDTVTNNGLLEARNGSTLRLNAATLAINGEVRGGGTITIGAAAGSTLPLSSTAALTPGDSANADGTGASLVGLLNITGNLDLSDSTALNFQLGADAAAGSTYDSVAVTGDLVLDGALNVTAQSGFGAGIYRLFTFTAGNLTDSTLELSTMPSGYSYAIDASNAGGYVDLVVTLVPEPATAVLALGGLMMTSRRRTWPNFRHGIQEE